MLRLLKQKQTSANHISKQHFNIVLPYSIRSSKLILKPKFCMHFFMYILFALRETCCFMAGRPVPLCLSCLDLGRFEMQSNPAEETSTSSPGAEYANSNRLALLLCCQWRIKHGIKLLVAYFLNLGAKIGLCFLYSVSDKNGIWIL
jgi:hypothetical protein